MASFLEVTKFILSNTISTPQLPTEIDYADIKKFIRDNILYVSFYHIIDDITEYYNILRKGAAELKLYSLVRKCALARTKYDMFDIYREMKVLATLVGMDSVIFPQYLQPSQHHRAKLIKPSFLKYPNPHPYLEPKRPNSKQLDPIILPVAQKNNSLVTREQDLQITIAEYEEKINAVKTKPKCCEAGLSGIFGTNVYSCDSFDRLILSD